MGKKAGVVETENPDAEASLKKARELMDRAAREYAKENISEGVKLGREAVRLLLHKLGFVLIKPTYKYVLADKHERKLFLRVIFDDIRSIFSIRT